VEAPKAGRTEIKAIGVEEARCLLDAALTEGSAYGDCVVLALHTGLRLGELLGLRWEDVDLERGLLTVRRTLQHLPGREQEFREPKTARSGRTIPLGSAAVSVLERLRRRQREERLASGPAYQNRGMVLSTVLGTPLDDRNVRRAFYRIARNAGVEPMRFHDLRHTHATLLLARGVHPKVVSERLGHATIGITLDTYSHVLPNLQEEAIKDFDAWLSAP
jgi:integrase